MNSTKIQTEDVFLEKYLLYEKMLYRIAFVFLGNKADAEEAVQEVFIKLCYHAPIFLDLEHEKAWLIRVVTNHCKNLLKSFWRRKVKKLDDLSHLFQNKVDQKNANLIFNLPLKYKMVIHLFYYEGYAVKEIAEILQISQSAVKMRLQRGREMLKLELEREY